MALTRNHAGDWPHADTVLRWFEDWPDAVREAGLDPAAPRPADYEPATQGTGRRPTWTKGACLEAFVAFAATHRRLPRPGELGRAHKLPTRPTIERYWESVPDLERAAVEANALARGGASPAPAAELGRRASAASARGAGTTMVGRAAAP